MIYRAPLPPFSKATHEWGPPGRSSSSPGDRRWGRREGVGTGAKARVSLRHAGKCEVYRTQSPAVPWWTSPREPASCLAPSSLPVTCPHQPLRLQSPPTTGFTSRDTLPHGTPLPASGCSWGHVTEWLLLRRAPRPPGATHVADEPGSTAQAPDSALPTCFHARLPGPYR